jgi:hypothetical protein
VINEAGSIEKQQNKASSVNSPQKNPKQQILLVNVSASRRHGRPSNLLVGLVKHGVIVCQQCISDNLKQVFEKQIILLRFVSNLQSLRSGVGNTQAALTGLKVGSVVEQDVVDRIDHQVDVGHGNRNVGELVDLVLRKNVAVSVKQSLRARHITDSMQIVSCKH